MDELSTRIVIIAVGVIVTLTIVTLLIGMYSQMKEIYGTVTTTDTSIYSTFNDVYSMYHGKTDNGLGLLNTLKKYEDGKDNIIVEYVNKTAIQQESDREVDFLKNLMEINETGDIKSYNGIVYRYQDKYYVTVTETTSGIILNYTRVN